ncbi:MAG: hypothetical protein C4542_02745 [Dehalococcoidia bacterium]|nr:MAG: hypothetical protein C4542_02745 [Dehalococcoidia bacterium]
MQTPLNPPQAKIIWRGDSPFGEREMKEGFSPCPCEASQLLWQPFSLILSTAKNLARISLVIPAKAGIQRIQYIFARKLNPLKKSLP